MHQVSSKSERAVIFCVDLAWNYSEALCLRSETVGFSSILLHIFLKRPHPRTSRDRFTLISPRAYQYLSDTPWMYGDTRKKEIILAVFRKWI